MIVGIDLGTTNSLACVWQDGQAILIPNSFKEYLTPSVVGLDDNNQIIVGKVAKERLMTAPDLTTSNFKRFIGTNKKIKLGKYNYSAEELSSFVLRKLIADAEAFLQEKVTEIIVSVPAYFNDAQRNATKNAGYLAGVHIERIINEPSAAALSSFYNKQEEKTYMIIDFGGGTLDISIVDAFDNIVEIVSVAGDNHLGGEDFNFLIYNEFILANNISVDTLSLADKEKIYKEAEKCKILLNTVNEVEMKVNISEITYSYVLSYETFFDLSKYLLLRLDTPIQKAIHGAKNKIDSIDEVILVGGSCRMKLVQEYIQNKLNIEINMSVNPDIAVALGCGVVAGIKGRKAEVKDFLLTDICPFTLGIEVVGERFQPIIERNSILPCSKEEKFCTVRLGQKKVDISIYQGESFYIEDNLKVGFLSVPVPKNLEQYESLTIRFTYDINGILDIDVNICSKNEHYHKTIVSNNNQMTNRQLKKRLQELEKLKMHPRDNEKYKYILERANRLFISLLGVKREMVAQWITEFEEALITQENKVIEKAYKTIKNNLDSIDKENIDGLNDQGMLS